MRFAYAGDRAIGVNILKFLLENGHRPLALMVTGKHKATHAEELIQLSDLDSSYIFEGNDFKKERSVQLFKSLRLDYIIGIHFPYIISKEILEIPSIGFLNLHPAYLPFNKGWHTPSWAIYEGTKYGATLHFMAEELDAGDIVYQKECIASPGDTANSLYQKVLQVEEEVFQEALPLLESLHPPRIKQTETGTSHLKKDLQSIQKIDLETPVPPKDFLKQLRALTTNNIDEAAWFEEGGKKWRVQVRVEEE